MAGKCELKGTTLVDYEDRPKVQEERRSLRFVFLRTSLPLPTMPRRLRFQTTPWSLVIFPPTPPMSLVDTCLPYRIYIIWMSIYWHNARSLATRSDEFGGPAHPAAPFSAVQSADADHSSSHHRSRSSRCIVRRSRRRWSVCLTALSTSLHVKSYGLLAVVSSCLLSAFP
jgi:hypothetical protein